MSFMRDLAILTGRLLVHNFRMPVFVIMSVIQPVIWLVLFGPLFGRITALGGFDTDSYVDFLVPGLAMMAALFGSAYAGMALLMDSDRGILDRFLVTPVSRLALISAYVMQSGVLVAMQATTIILVGLFMGAEMGGGFFGYLVILLAAFLLGSAFGALSNALALIVPRHDAIIAVMNFIILPLVFLSSMMMATEALPAWIGSIAALNPVDWAVRMSRDAYFGGTWSAIAWYGTMLTLFSAFCVALAVRAFHRFMEKA